jgi:hypothetical protein
MYKGRIAGVQLIEPEPTPPPKPAEISLSEYKEHCENHYPALFLDQVFANSEKLGTITSERAANWDASSSNYRSYNEKLKKECQSNFARKILTIAISRLANNPEFVPTVNHENKLNHLLKPLEDPTMEDPLQLEYILNEFINHPELV